MTETNENTRDFKGIWIPKEIYLHPDLSWTEKLLYCEIDSLDGEEGCFASNEYFAKFLGVSERIITSGISKLKALGFISQESFDGRKRVLRVRADLKESSGQGRKKLLGRPDKNFDHNNIVNNIDYKKESIKESDESIKNYPLDKFVIDKWNDIAKRFKLPQISKMTNDRRLRLSKVLKENDITVEQYFDILTDKIRKSLFLQGLKQVKDGAGDWRFECADWQSNFDFYLEKGKMLKVIEDVYTDKVFLK